MWQLQEAKNKLSALLVQAQNEPQIISKRGEPCAVLLSISMYNSLVQKTPSFKTFLLSTPPNDISFDRTEANARPIDL